MNRVHRLLSELVPGQRKRDITTGQAKTILATVKPRDVAGKTRRRLAAEQIAELVAIEKKIKALTKELKEMVLASGSTLMELPGVGPVVAARTLADTGDVARFADRNRYASWTGTAPIEASSGEVVRHRLSRAGNRRMNHMIHIAAATQIRLDTPGRAYYRRKLAAGKSRREAMRCLKRRISDALYRRLRADAKPPPRTWTRVREGTAGRHFSPARPASTRTPALRISHFPDPHQRRYPRPRRRGRPRRERPSNPPLDIRGVPLRRGCVALRVMRRADSDRQTPSSGSVLELQEQDDLAVGVDVTGRDESESCVEAGRVTVAGHIAGEELGGPMCADQLHDLAQDLLSVAEALMAEVDEELPQEPWPVGVGRLRPHVPTQHDEPNGLLIGVNGPVPRVCVLVHGGLGDRVPDAADELLLLRGGAHSQDRLDVGLGDLAEGNSSRPSR